MTDSLVEFKRSHRWAPARFGFYRPLWNHLIGRRYYGIFCIDVWRFLIVIQYPTTTTVDNVNERMDKCVKEE